MSNETVLVTGASGFVAQHVVKTVLEAGYKVRGTVRDPTNEKKCKPLRELCPQAATKLELVKADLLKADDWPAAVKGCQYVLHVASPLPVESPRNADEVIQPALQGTKNVLKAAAESGNVKRVVYTSAGFNVIRLDKPENELLDENDWSDEKQTWLTPYMRSKLLAEKAVWEFKKEIEQKGNKMEITVVVPPFILGPVLNTNDLSSSGAFMQKMITGKPPIVPNIGFAMVDVRDVATGHLKAMTAPAAAGQRIIVTSGFMWFKEMADLLRKEFEPQGFTKIPSRVAPKFLMYIISWFNSDLAAFMHFWGRKIELSQEKMKSILKMEPIPKEKTIIDGVKSLIENGVVAPNQTSGRK